MSKYELTHACHDPAHCLAPGLFRSLKRGERKTEKLAVRYSYNSEQHIEFSGPEPLGADDLRVLQGLVAVAGPSGLMLSPEPKTEAGQQLRLLLEPKWDAVHHDALVAKGSYRGLAREVGYASIANTQPIRECIERLWKVSIIVQIRKKRYGYRLLSSYASDEVTGGLYVALNPRVTEAILGGQHVRICMHEVRSLRSDVARLMHQRLCGWINQGSRGRVSVDTLCSYAWPEPPSAETLKKRAETLKKRRQRVRQALTEFGDLGWKVTEYAAGMFLITRSKPTRTLTVPSADG